MRLKIPSRKDEVYAPMENKKKLSSAYTLIEILVSILIIATLFGIGYANFRAYARRQAVISVARQVEADLKLAQELALSGNKPDDCTVFDGINFIIGEGTYSLKAKCSPEDSVSLGKEDVSLPSGLTLDLSGNNESNPNAILFKSVGQGTDIQESEAIITISQEATRLNARIIVQKSGEITLK